MTSPCIKVVGRRDSAPNTVRGADGQVLRERLGAVDRRCIGAGDLVDVVRAAVARDRAHVGGSRARVVVTVGVHDVVFDQRISGPAVDGQVGVAAWVEGAGVGEGSGARGVY